MNNLQKNYFDLFELPIKLPLDRDKLALCYQQLQRQYHPDNFATSEESARLAMLQYSADINQAYQILDNPLSSAQYLLALNGIDIDPEKNIINDHAFLIQQFELREQLDIIANLRDLPEKEQQLTEFTSTIKNIWQESYTLLLSAIARSDWSLATSQINTLRFLEKLQQDIDILEEKLFDF
ncbi:Fe-S protein assembly co-chaperone HscB [Utexia brackfieldae]|uniref:Fe-S protein assembly co-chaperone HscB n=1 Tax=Utexia brackfieldae TaxID=3074108 RepID=UPI00370D8BFC